MLLFEAVYDYLFGTITTSLLFYLIVKVSDQNLFQYLRFVTDNGLCVGELLWNPGRHLFVFKLRIEKRIIHFILPIMHYNYMYTSFRCPMDPTSKTRFPVEFLDKNCTIYRVRQIMIICGKKVEKKCPVSKWRPFYSFSFRVIAQYHEN